MPTSARPPLPSSPWRSCARQPTPPALPSPGTGWVTSATQLWLSPLRWLERLAWRLLPRLAVTDR
jgi:hypothetical protein